MPEEVTKKKSPQGDPALRTWRALNDAVRSADEAECRRLLKLEKRGASRDQFLQRIFSRLNRVRAERERKGLK